MGTDYSAGEREAPLSYYDVEFPGSGVRVDVHFSIMQALNKMQPNQ